MTPPDDKNEKTLARHVVRTYLEREAPEQLADFDIAFDAVYRSVSNQLATLGEPEVESGEPGLPFGPELVDASLILFATSITVLYLRQSTATREWSRALERFEEQLVAQGKDLAMIRNLVEASRSSEPSGPAVAVAPQPLSQSWQPADLEIRVTTKDDGDPLVLDYVLHSPNGRFRFSHKPFPSVRLKHPSARQKRIHDTLENLHRGLDSRGAPLNPTDVTADLAALGEELCDELFPSELQRALQEVEQAETVVLISDEPWIPWEIVKPYDGDPSREGDDGFLASRFQLTRWLAGGRPPAARVEVDRLLVVEAGSPKGSQEFQPLKKASAELRFLQELAARHDVEDARLTDAIHNQVVVHLRDHDFGLIHFVGHGEHDVDNPATSGFYLCDGRTLRPRDLRRDIRGRLHGNRPLVFLNACQAGRQGWSLTRPAGWARRFVLDAGCGAFVAPQWTVDDGVAHTFAKTFYEALERGETFGRARLEAHRALAEEPLGRLAYAVYADPNGQLQLGKAPPVTTLSTGDRVWKAGSNVEKNRGEAEPQPIARRAPVPMEPTTHGMPLDESRQRPIGPDGPPTRRALPRNSRRGVRAKSSRTGLSSRFWTVIMVPVLLAAAGLTAMWRFSSAGVNMDFNSGLMTMMQAIKGLDLWIVAMLGLGLFFLVIFKILKKSKVGQFDGDQTLRFFRFVIAFPFLLALVGLVILAVRSVSSSPGSFSESSEERIKRLTLDMKSEDPTASRQAMEALVPYGAEAAREIVQAISEEAGVLAADTSMFEVFLAALGQQSWDTPFMSNAIASLERIGEPSIVPMVEQLGVESLVLEDMLSQMEAQKASQAQRQEASPNANIDDLFMQWNFYQNSTGQSLRIAIVQKAFERGLLGMGAVAVPALLNALKSPRLLVRQTSFQVLTQMPEAHEPTARCLRDMAESADNEREAKQLLAAAEALD